MNIKFPILTILFLGSCGILANHSRLSPDKYLQWFNDPNNCYRTMTTVKEIEYNLQYLPKETFAAKCLINKCDHVKNIKAETNEKQSELSFLLNISLPTSNFFDFNAESEIRKENRMEYFSFGMKEDVCLITKSLDTVDCSQIYFERTPSDFPVGRFQLIFPYVDFQNVKYIRIRNRALGNEEVVLQYKEIKKKDIANLKY